MKRIVCVIAAMLLCAACFGLPAAAAEETAPRISAGCCVVMDADTQAVLYARHPDTPGLIASTTKIMTGYLVCLEGGLEQKVTVPAQAVGVEGSSLYLREGETLTREDLLLGMMLHSGNDAALALAISVAGSEAAFVDRMNRTARELGLQNTAFANPHGLDSEGNYGSARDLALLTAAALGQPDFRRVVGTKAAVIAGDRALTNHNKLLWRCPGCIGVKTGYTRAAGRLLVSAAEREGRTLICVTVNDPDDWRDHRNLLDWGFAQYRSEVVARAGQPLMTAPGGSPLIAREDLKLALGPGESPRLVYVPGLSYADAGEVRVLRNGTEVARVPVDWG